MYKPLIANTIIAIFLLSYSSHTMQSRILIELSLYQFLIFGLSKTCVYTVDERKTGTLRNKENNDRYFLILFTITHVILLEHPSCYINSLFVALLHIFFKTIISIIL